MYKFPSIEAIEEEIDDEIAKELGTLTEIKTDAEANDFIGKFKYNEALKTELSLRAKEIIENYKYKVDLWLQKQLDTLDNENARIQGMVAEYYSNNPDVQSGKKDKIKFVNGNVGMYTVQRDGYDWADDKALLQFIQDTRKANPLVLGGIVKLEPKLDKTAIKEKANINDEGNIMVDGVELPYVGHHNKVMAIAIR